MLPIFSRRLRDPFQKDGDYNNNDSCIHATWRRRWSGAVQHSSFGERSASQGGLLAVRGSRSLADYKQPLSHSVSLFHQTQLEKIVLPNSLLCKKKFHQTFVSLICLYIFELRDVKYHIKYNPTQNFHYSGLENNSLLKKKIYRENQNVSYYIHINFDSEHSYDVIRQIYFTRDRKSFSN